MQEFTEQTLLYWKLVHHLVDSEQYRPLKINDEGEVWLQPQSNKGKRAVDFVRIIRKDLDWGNWISKDLSRLSYGLNHLQGRIFAKKAKVVNVYVSTYPPVDEWEGRLKSENRIQTYLIDQDNRVEVLEELAKALNISLPMTDNWIHGTDETISSLISDVKQTAKRLEEEIKNMVSYGKPFFTYVFLAINAIMFFLQEYLGGSTDPSVLISLGAKFNPLIMEGEWWRFLTPMLLHIGIAHLIMNSLALFYLGSLVERMYGSVRFLLIYILAGAFGTIASFAFNTQLSAGASGAIFGCFGALLYFGVVNPSLFFRTMGMNVLVVLGINIMFGIAVPMIDNSGHIGGLVGGFLTAAIVTLPKTKKVLLQLLSLFLLTGGGYAMLSYGFSGAQQVNDPSAAVQTASHYLENGEIEEAYELLNNVVKNSEEDLTPEVYFLLSFAEIKLEQYDNAVLHLEKAIEGKNDFHEAYFYLALVYAELGDMQKARATIEKALAIQPEEKQYQDIYDQFMNMK